METRHAAPLARDRTFGMTSFGSAPPFVDPQARSQGARAASESRKSDGTRIRILEAALHVLSRDGPTKASMQDIARRAGLSRQGLYFHFGGKDELTYEAARHHFETAHAEVRAILASGRPTTGRLVDALAVWHNLRHSGSRRSSRVALFWEGHDLPVIDRVVEMVDSFEKSFVALLARAIAANGPDPRRESRGGSSAIEAASVLNAAARGLSLHHSPVSPKANARLLRLAVTRICAG